ncbi:MAG: UDP-N-acetylmuramate--L-alanine ligase [Phycisphaerae bacterium]|nr:MAG: UDP-N-acetylmuramate--L-alanine ligase [Phycisphaerae bacterium]
MRSTTPTTQHQLSVTPEVKTVPSGVPGIEPRNDDRVRPVRKRTSALSWLGGASLAGRAVHLLGVGGSGMSGLARMLAARGARVTGTDREPSAMTEALLHGGIGVTYEHAGAGLPEACDLVVASAAISPGHPLYTAAVARGVEVVLYAEALGACMAGRVGVAVAGTHGKSTTTAMLGCVLTDAGLDPTVIVGATSSQLERGCLGGPTGAGSGFRLGAATTTAGPWGGKPGILVAEACEYNRSFHHYRPKVACISSVEADHLDCYATFDAVIESFREFAAMLPTARAGGKLLIGHDNTQRARVTAGLRCKVETIGFSPEADWVVEFDPGTRRVTVVRDRAVVGTWINMVPGAHNAVNAATAFVMARWLGAERGRMEASLAAFAGIDRRMQRVGEVVVPGGAVRVYDDYGHHPTEVDTTLRALREYERPEARGGRLICVFQPHQHSRTRHLLEEFAQSFSQADVVIVPPIYFVRDSEAEKTRVSSADLVARLRERGSEAMHLDTFGAIVEHLQNLCRPGDVVVTMGAGPVWQVAREFVAGVRGLAAA